MLSGEQHIPIFPLAFRGAGSALQLTEPRNAINEEIRSAMVLGAAVEPSPVGVRAAIIPVFHGQIWLLPTTSSLSLLEYSWLPANSSSSSKVLVPKGCFPKFWEVKSPWSLVEELQLEM